MRCPQCNGYGWLVRTETLSLSRPSVSSTTICPGCDGSGIVAGKEA